MNPAPIALFAYKRRWHLEQTVGALLRNPEAHESDLVVFSDGAKSAKEESAIAEVRRYLRGISGPRTVTIIERERNFGLANSIIDGVTRLCNEHGRVIVLEDDLKVSRNFLQYMNSALERYRNERAVMQVSGYMFPVEVNCGADAFFLPLTTSWGWGTWSRAWENFDGELRGWEKVQTASGLKQAFDLDGSYAYSDMVRAQLSGSIDSWAIRWYLSVFLLGGMVLYPRHSLVENLGLEGSGTHDHAPNLRASEIRDDFQVKMFPEPILDREAFDRVKLHLRGIRARSSSLGRRLIDGILGRR